MRRLKGEVPEWRCTDGARGEGWGTRGSCPHCGQYMFDGTESVTEEAFREHFPHCEGLRVPADVSVRRTGCAPYPWEARCRAHRGRREAHITDYGVVAFNSQGVGNRTWELAMLAAEAHLRRYHA